MPLPTRLDPCGSDDDFVLVKSKIAVLCAPPVFHAVRFVTKVDEYMVLVENPVGHLTGLRLKKLQG